MKVQTPFKGEIVQSIQGRDSGGYMVVTEVLNGFVLIADGGKRKLASPKRKNVKHLRLLPQSVADYGIKEPWNKAFDDRVRHLLKNFKEGEKTVKPED